MKTRESGMPDEGYWATFFDPEGALTVLGLDRVRGRIIDVGSGYGTFTLPAARLSGQPVLAIDIEPDLVAAVERRAFAEGLANVTAIARDVAAVGLGEADGSAEVVLLFNLLHCEEPQALLREAFRVLADGGRVAAMHWRSDIPTPRGPDLSIRPRPEDIERWMIASGFTIDVPTTLLPPYHFGLVGRVQRPRGL